MNTTRVATIHRQLAKLHAELAEEIEHADARPDEWVDQDHSPLGKRKHLDLVRAGRLEGIKPDRKRVLVRRTAIDAYIETHGVKRTVAAGPKPSHGGSARKTKSVAQIRAEIGLVRTRRQA